MGEAAAQELRRGMREESRSGAAPRPTEAQRTGGRQRQLVFLRLGAHDEVVLGVDHPEVHEQLLQIVHLDGRRNGLHLVLVDLSCQRPVLLGHRGLRVVLEHRHPAKLGVLDTALSRGRK